MEFKLFKDYVERICALNAQLDVQSDMDKELEDRVGDLTAELSKQINSRSIRNYFLFDCKTLIEKMQSYFVNQQINCRIETSNNSIIIATDSATYFIDRYKQSEDKVFIPLYHLDGGLMCLMQAYPEIYDILWELINQNYANLELENIYHIV